MEFLHLLEQARTPFLNSFMHILTELGDETLGLGILCLIYWCIDKKCALTVGLTYFVSGLFNNALKVTARVDRPWVLDPTLTPLESALGTTGNSFSFPSGHTQSATGLFMPLGLYTKKWYFKAFCFAAFLIVGFTRLYFGVHTPIDVIAAIIFTGIIALAIHFFYNRLEKNYIATGIGIALFSIGVLIYILVLFSKGIIPDSMASSISKSVGAGIGFGIGWIIEHRYINFSTACKKPFHQVIKFIVGIALTVALKSGLKPILGASIAAGVIRYIIVVLFAIAVYPLIFKAVLPKKE